MKIKDIKIGDYLAMTNRTKYDVYFEYIKPSNKIRHKEASMLDLTFDEVSVLKRMVVKENIESLGVIIEIFYTFDDINNIYLYEVIGFKKWIKIEFEKLIEREKVLESAPDAKMIQAGSDRLKKFAEDNTKQDIGEQFGCRPSEVGTWKYSEVFRIMERNKIKSEIARARNKIK